MVFFTTLDKIRERGAQDRSRREVSRYAKRMVSPFQEDYRDTIKHTICTALKFPFSISLAFSLSHGFHFENI